MINGNACFAYFNKIWGIPNRFAAPRTVIERPSNRVSNRLRVGHPRTRVCPDGAWSPR